MKRCSSCKIEKPLEEFHLRNSSSDGRRSSCKKCRSLEYLLNPNPTKVRSRKNYYNNYERCRALSKKWSEENKVKMNEYKYDWRRRNSEKRKAHYIVQNAIRDGRLSKSNCSICDTEKYVHAHHPDYSKPLEIIWLCAKHHSDEHKKLKVSLQKI